jgi:serine/threonine protein kinase
VNFSTIVTSAHGVVPDAEKSLPESESDDWPFIHNYVGLHLMQKKKPPLNEIQACKIASQLLEAMVYLLDMHLVHDDLSHRNYLVEENLDVRFAPCCHYSSQTDVR